MAPQFDERVWGHSRGVRLFDRVVLRGAALVFVGALVLGLAGVVGIGLGVLLFAGVLMVPLLFALHLQVFGAYLRADVIGLHVCNGVEEQVVPWTDVERLRPSFVGLEIERRSGAVLVSVVLPRTHWATVRRAWSRADGESAVLAEMGATLEPPVEIKLPSDADRESDVPGARLCLEVAAVFIAIAFLLLALAIGLTLGLID